MVRAKLDLQVFGHFHRLAVQQFFNQAAGVGIEL